MKILDTEFRKNLYKSLVDAGYDKAESQKIIGVKYYNALKEKVNAVISNLTEKISSEEFDTVLDEKWLVDFNSDIIELKKMKEIIQS